MKYVRLGRTGFGVSPICLGTMAYGPPRTEPEIIEIIHGVLDLGINYIDTANCYDGPRRGDNIFGIAESMLGKALAGGRRDDVILQTKVGVPLREGPQNRGLSSAHLVREVDNCLRRLATDRLDVLFLHWPDAFADEEEVLRVIERLVASGKVLHFGVSNHQAWQVCEYLWLADRNHWPKPAVAQIPLSLLERRYENDLPFYVKHQIAVTPYQPLQAGLLARTEITSETQANYPPATLAAHRAFSNLARELSLSPAALALAWVASRSGVVAPVVGITSVEHVASALEAVQVCLPQDALEQIDRFTPGPPPPRPRFER